MKFFWVLCIVFGCLFDVKGQLTPEHFSADTITYNFRTGGSSDSADFSLKRLIGTTPGGGNDFPSLVPTIDFFNSYRNGNRFSVKEQWLKPTFSGLPHIGLAYTFGAVGTSLAQLNYQQVFAKQLLVNLKFKNDRGNTQLRNGVYRMNDIDVLLMRQGKIWSTSLDFKDHVNQSNLNNGLDTSADLSLFDLSFQPVQRLNAQSKFRTTDLRWKNFFSIVHFDSLTALGILTEHRLAIQSRKYSETDSLQNYYSFIQFDTISTNDKFQWSQTMQQAGLFFKNRNIYTSIQAQGTYWKYYNQGERDTVELAVLGTIKLNVKGWELAANARINITGAGQGWSGNATILKKWNRIAWNLNVELDNEWASPFLRYYSANNALYNNYASLQKQFRATLRNDLKFKFNEKIHFLLSVKNSFFDRNLFFDSTAWNFIPVQAFNIQEFKLRASWEPKFLLIQPEYAFTLTNGIGNFIPQNQAKLRVMAKGKLFKAKKLLAWAGVDLHYFSSSRLLAFNPSMDVYQLQSQEVQNGLFNLHLFAGLQIDEFRFFVRYENLGYLWNDHSQRVLVNYPIPGGALQVGLTWDFFN
ncbi:MAG: putative porin [Bacteroidota bacterium]